MKEQSKKSGISWFIALSIGISFLYLLDISWLKWGDLIIDTGREFWLPQQLLQGRILYKDLFYEYGFFIPHVLSFIYRVFGVHINSLIGCGILVTILMCFVLYKISRLFLDELVSGLAVLTFLFVFAFGAYQYINIFNFILPYSFVSIFFILFISLALYFFIKFIFFERKKHLLYWSIFLSLAFLSRVELSFFIWAGFLLSGGLFIFKNKERRPLCRGLYLFSPLLIGILGYFLFLLKTGGFAGFKESIFIYISSCKGSVFNLSVMGLNNISGNILLALKSFLLHLVFILSIGIASGCISSFFLAQERPRFRLILGAAIIFSVFKFSQNYMELGLQYRCMPLILIIGILIFFIKALRSIDPKKNISLLTLFVISLVAILRVFLNATPFHYGFYLLALGLICYYIFFFEMFKVPLQRYIKNFSAPVFSIILICYFILLINCYWRPTYYIYTHKNLDITTERGNIYCWDDARTNRFWEAVDYLKKNSSKDDKVAVIPEGVAINFFSERENPAGYSNFVPPVCKAVSEEKIISRFTESGIDYIVLVHRPTGDYGYTFFGKDYAQRIYSWISDNYEIAALIGSYPFSTNDFGIAIFKKK